MGELKKVLSYRAILLITINSIVGTGIFFLPALGVGKSGPSSLISWLILSFISIYMSMIFGELISMYPKAGGIYEYTKQAFGRFTSFLIGWILIIAGNVTTAMLIVGAVQYLMPYPAPFLKIVIALFFIAVFNFVAYRGLKTSAVMLITFSVITLSLLASVIFGGFFSLNFSNFFPFFVFPASAVITTMFFVVETFFGWESATFLAEEVKDARKVMPKVLIISTIVIAFLALSLTAVFVGMGEWIAIGSSDAPLSDIGGMIFGDYGAVILTMGTYLAIIGAVASWIVSSPRLVMAMTRDKLFIPHFKRIHPKYSTPHYAILFQSIVTSIIVFMGFGSYQQLLSLLVPMMLIVYSFVAFALLYLRIKKPDVPRYFRVPFAKPGSILIIIFNISIVIIWVRVEHGAFQLVKLGASLLLIAFPLYFLLQMYYSPRSVAKVNDILAYFILFTERLYLPMGLRKEILHLFGDISNKRILEFGCGVGTFTLLLGKAVSPKGKIYATDISQKELDIAGKRFAKQGFSHISILHDPKHHERVHPKIPKVDAVVSFGMMGYLQDVKKVLDGLNRRLKTGDKICMVEYDKFFDVIPNIEWLSDDKKVKKIFSRSGFSVGVIRKQGFAWQNIFIYGKKKRSIR